MFALEKWKFSKTWEIAKDLARLKKTSVGDLWDNFEMLKGIELD
jgi:hypothetical protein